MKSIGANRTKIALHLINAVIAGIAAGVLVFAIGAWAWRGAENGAVIAGLVGAMTGISIAGPAFAALGIVIGGAAHDEEPDA